MTSLRSSWASEQLSFFEPLQLHLELANLLDQLRFLGLNFLFVLALAAPCEQLAGTIQKLPLPMAHLDRVNGVISSDLLDRFATTDRIHGELGLELGAVGGALVHRWEPRSGAVPRLKG